MKAMKGLSMKSMLGSVRGRSGGKYRYVLLAPEDLLTQPQLRTELQ